jgi:hypothetical protein
MKILEKLKTNYPMIEEGVLTSIASIIEGNFPNDIQSQEAAYEQYVPLLDLLKTVYEQSVATEDQLAEYLSQEEVIAGFKKAVAEELTARQVPDNFWKVTLDMDDARSTWKEAADAIQESYNAYIQEENDQEVSKISRPEGAVRREGHSSAVEAYIRSLRSDSPLMGKLKE